MFTTRTRWQKTPERARPATARRARLRHRGCRTIGAMGPMPPIMAAMLSLAAACAPATSSAARASATERLNCAGDDLRIADLGELVIHPGAPVQLSLYGAEGCAAETSIVCRHEPEVACAPDAAALVPAHLAAAAEQAQRLRRSASRARCAPETVRVIQESLSLWRYEACDGTHAYHCRSGRCERL